MDGELVYNKKANKELFALVSCGIGGIGDILIVIRYVKREKEYYKEWDRHKLDEAKKWGKIDIANKRKGERESS